MPPGPSPSALAAPSSFGEDSCGRLYVASLQTGAVSRFTGSVAGCPAIPAPAPPTADAPYSQAPPRRCHGLDATIQASTVGKVRGTSGRDVISGTSGRDVIRARGGRDLICAREGADKLDGGRGKDRIRGGPGRDHCTRARADRFQSC